MKQKAFSILLTLLMSMAANVALAYDAQIDGIYYNFNGTEATVTSGDNQYTGDIVIPETVTYNDTTYSVVSIGYLAFYGSGLTSITIPNGVTTIGDGAFYCCNDLTTVTIPNSVTRIDTDAFTYCRSLTSIMIPKSVTNISPYNFRFCGSLTTIVVEEGNTKYDSRNNCNAIIETSSNTLMTGCQNTTIPNSVTTIGQYSFSGRYGLTSITIPNSVTTIDSNTFDCCSNLTSVTIPSSVTSIGKGAFESCTSLTSIIIPNSITSIEEKAFMCSGLTTITIPNSVTSIKQSAFQQCYNLFSITIPSSMMSIGKQAFFCCDSLQSVYCDANTVPTTYSDTFGDSPIDHRCILHVPSASVNAYKTTSPWSDFKDVVALSSVDAPDQKIALDGTTTVELGLTNSETNFVGFQMDLTLPEGVSIDKTGCVLSSRITDEDQEMTIGKLASGAYRITSTSLSLKPISGNSGTLLSLKLMTEANFEGGQATISNIRFSTANSVKVLMSDETFDIDILKKYNVRYLVDGEVYATEEVVETTPLTLAEEPTKAGYTFGGWSGLPETMPDHDVVVTGRFYLYGDVNTDEEVDVVDVVDIARFVVATPSASFREKLADLNSDNTVNIADAVVLVNYIAGDQNFARAMAPSRQYDYAQCQLQLLSTQENALSFCLGGDADFTAFQFDVELPDNVDVTAMSINGLRKDGHQLFFNKIADNRYRVAALSLSNAIFQGSTGELLNISIDGHATEEISVHDIHFVTKNGTDITYDSVSLSDAVTGIVNIHANEGNKVIYDLQGRKLSKVQRGVNIIRSAEGRLQGKKIFVNKR